MYNTILIIRAPELRGWSSIFLMLEGYVLGIRALGLDLDPVSYLKLPKPTFLQALIIELNMRFIGTLQKAGYGRLRYMPG